MDRVPSCRVEERQRSHDLEELLRAQLWSGAASFCKIRRRRSVVGRKLERDGLARLVLRSIAGLGCRGRPALLCKPELGAKSEFLRSQVTRWWTNVARGDGRLSRWKCILRHDVSAQRQPRRALRKGRVQHDILCGCRWDLRRLGRVGVSLSLHKTTELIALPSLAR